MSTPVIIAVVVVIFVAVGLWFFVEQRRTRLKKQFGPEYDRAIKEAGSPRRAESELEMRARRVRRYELKRLPYEESLAFAQAWRELQARFIDDPAGSVGDADRLVIDLMTARGYPMADFDRHVEDLSVHHAKVVNHYRDAHAIAVRQAGPGASTEELRQALVHYRMLFDDLLETHEPMRKGA